MILTVVARNGIARDASKLWWYCCNNIEEKLISVSIPVEIKYRVSMAENLLKGVFKADNCQRLNPNACPCIWMLRTEF